MSDTILSELALQQQKTLEEYCDIVMQYNSIFDLTNAKDKNDFRKNHIEDALLPLHKIKKIIPSSVSNIYDIGSGCGVPGIVLAIALPNYNFHLIERGSRRADFLLLCLSYLKLNSRVDVIKKDIAEIKDNIEFAVTRALEGFSTIESDLYNSLRQDGRLVLYKGKIDKTNKMKFCYFKSHETIVLDSKDRERCLLVLQK